MKRNEQQPTQLRLWPKQKERPLYKRVFFFARTASGEFADANPFTFASSIAFYTLFSLPAIVLLVIQALGKVWGEQEVAQEVKEQGRIIVGEEATAIVDAILQNSAYTSGSWWLTVVGVVALVVGSTTVFGAIQQGLNAVFRVEVKPEVGWRKLLRDRLFSFTIVVVLSFLLMVSFVLDAVMAIGARFLTDWLDEGAFVLLRGVSVLVSIAVVTALFVLLFKLLPDVVLSWGSVLRGALLTTALFLSGKFLLQAYLAESSVVIQYGGAGSLVLVLVWVYYSSLMLLLGGKLTELIARYRGELSPTSWVNLKSQEA